MDADTVEASYPLSPMQHGMLFHSLYAAGAGVYVQQMVCDLREDLDVAAFARAWRRLSERHPILRTSFRWDGPGEPLQEVHARVEIPLEEHDWSGLPAVEREARFADYVRVDRRRGFDFRAAPLMRLALVRLGGGHYRLLWTSHHALLDGRSRRLLVRELFKLYEALRRGRDAALEEPRPYGDYVEWLRRQDWDDSRRYWRQTLEGLEAPTPVDGPRAPESAARAEGVGEQRLLLSEASTEALRSTVNRLGVTLSTALQGAWALLLSHYTDTTDVVFGVTRACRWEADGDPRPVAGLFINTLPVRVSVAPDATLSGLLRGLREQHLRLRAHEHTPLVKVSEWTGRPAGTPLFESLLVFENYELNAELRSQGGDWARREFRLLEQTNYPLTVAGYAGKELTLKLLYDRSRFDDAAVARMLGHLRNLLEAFTADPERRVSEVSPLTEREREQVLREWNRTRRDFDAAVCLHQLFEAQAARTPDAPAVECDGESITYAELNRRADRLAHDLSARGVGRGHAVAVLFERADAGALTAILAALKAGAAYVPLDAEYPRARLQDMLEEARASVLLTRSALVEKLPLRAEQIIRLDLERPDLAGQDEAATPAVVNGSDLAYAIFTSGSTGRPKAVACSHAGVVNLLADFGRRQPLAAGDRCSVWTSLSFDVSVYEIFSCLCAGATLVAHPERVRLDGPAFAAWMSAAGVTGAYLPPFMLRDIAAWLRGGGRLSLRRLLVGVEPIPHGLLAELAGRIPGVRVINGYGPTEATVCATLYDVSAESAATDETRPAPIGRPVQNTQVYLLDSQLRPVPVGVPGEVYIGGAGLARGYLGRPARTAERFVPDPFSDEPGARLYRTGDRARWDAHGELEFLGRLDHQVKLRGFRIELGEIESALRRLEGVSEAVAVVREDAPGEKRLVAYVVAATEVGEAEVRRHAQSLLPAYMVPAAFVFLGALPLTPSGKLDRHALPEPEAARGDAYVSPRTPAEELVANAWAEVLGVERVGACDNFFALGGHSLLATRVLWRVREQLGVELPLRALFERPTARELASLIEELSGERETVEDDGAFLPSAARETEGLPPLSYPQQQIWLVEQLHPGTSAYHIPRFVRLRGPLDRDALGRALSEIVRRHEALRTGFVLRGAGPVQLIAPPLPLSLPVEEIEAANAEAREALLRRRLAEEARSPFDLEAGPLLRARLFRLGEGEHVLSLLAHHLGCDGWSFGVLCGELEKLYAAFARGEASPLPEPQVQYADFAVWQRGRLRGAALERQLEYWRGRLEGAPEVLELPVARARPSAPGLDGETFSTRLGAELAGELKRFGDAHGGTLFMVLLAGFQLLLARYAGREDIVVGTPVAGRPRREVEQAVGLFVNTLALRVRVSWGEGFGSLLGRVRDECLGAYQHQEAPFERLVEELRPERSVAHAPIFQVLFALHNAPQEPPRLPGLEAVWVEVPAGGAKYDLTLTAVADDDGLRVRWGYNTALFDVETVRRMAVHYETLLRGAVADPARPVGRLPLPGEEERRQLLAEWHGAEAARPQGLCLHELFEEQAARTPGALALACEGERLTYAQLNARANSLARHLRALGVGPEAAVGILMPRSNEVVVALLAVLKAGGAYVPLDAEYPEARLRHMVEDAGIGVVVTTEELGALLPTSVRQVCLDTEREEIVGHDTQNLSASATGANAAYVIYTSGSTGRPKGVLVEHRQLVNYVFGISERLGPARGSGFALVSGFAADLGHTALFPSLTGGAALHIISRERALDGAALGEYFSRNGVDFLKIVPSHLSALLAAGDEASGVIPRRCLVLGGEASGYALVEKVRALDERCRILNHYGPTETTVGVLTHEVEGEHAEAETTVPLGRPLPNVRAYVLDERMELAPVGVPGELYIGGRCVARGYVGRPSLTAERFVPDPFSGEPGARLYRTGDRARRLASGELEFLGRLDHQVKLRGFRVELGEVEAGLREHPAVREAAVMVRGEGGGARLVAYVVAAPMTDEAELRRHAQSLLPGYMVPAAIVFMGALPLTPNGKLDRRALPEPEAGEGAGASYEEPRTAVERVVCELLAALLGVARVGVEDNFFALGGHSLLGARALGRVGEVLRVRLPLRALFERPTARGLARAVEEAEGRAGQAERVASLWLRVQGAGQSSDIPK